MKWNRSWLLALALTSICVPLHAQTPAEAGPSMARMRQARVGPDDTVTIYALNVEEISKAWRVSATGDLSLPMIGRVRAAGLTVEQLEKQIANQLEQFVLQPQVTLYVSESRSQPVTVTGAVDKPGTVH